MPKTIEELKARINELGARISPLEKEWTAARKELAQLLSPYTIDDLLERTVEVGYGQNKKKKVERWKVISIKPTGYRPHVGTNKDCVVNLRQVKWDGTLGDRTTAMYKDDKWRKIGQHLPSMPSKASNAESV